MRRISSVLGSPGEGHYDVKSPSVRCSVVSDSFRTPWTVARQAALSLGFSRQEYWSGLPFPSPGDLPDTGIQPISLALAGGFLPAKPPEKP